MKNTTKTSLLMLAAASVLTLMGCSNANQLIVPDGTHRVPINQGAVTESLTKINDNEAESLRAKVKQLQQEEQVARTKISSLESELASYKLQLQIKPNAAIATVPTSTLKKANLLASTLFKFNQSALLKAGKTALKDLAKSIQLLDEVQIIEIIGHTDRLGESKHNEVLASKRAKVVRNYLQSQAKLDPLHFEVQSRGGLIPSGKTEHCTEALAHEALIECLSPDRRVEINVYGKPKA